MDKQWGTGEGIAQICQPYQRLFYIGHVILFEQLRKVRFVFGLVGQIFKAIHTPKL